MLTQLQTTLVLWLAKFGSDRGRDRGDEGQTLAEYAMILGLIAVVVVAVVLLLGNEQLDDLLAGRQRHLTLKLLGRMTDRTPVLHVFNSNNRGQPPKEPRHD